MTLMSHPIFHHTLTDRTKNAKYALYDFLCNIEGKIAGF